MDGVRPRRFGPAIAHRTSGRSRVAAFALAASLAPLAFGACRSTAPYTVPATAINTGVAAGLSAAQRLQGGCYSQCTNGTVCNTRTGYCVPVSDRQVCIEDGSGGMRCTPLAIGSSATPAPPVSDFSIGVSPATGSVPPPPGEASPKPP
ncbi:MAG TPA: hypothetical protein VMT17_15740 [Anaeromyxobacteraceae bacterium]|nr:hypothetical protein [Anaeromyxobacteraceae bacterium]